MSHGTGHDRLSLRARNRRAASARTTLIPRPRSRRTALAVLTAAVTCGAMALQPAVAQAGTTPVITTGTINGANWKAEVPANWNGTVLLWNHGIRLPTSTDRSAEIAPTGSDGSAAAALLARGYALLGSSYRSQGFAVRDAVNDDLALLAAFKTSHPGRVTRTLVWGASLGGLITETLAEERPTLFAGAAPGCGVLAGAVPIADQTLDSALMVKAIMLPTLKVGGYTSDADAAAAATAVKNGILSLLGNPATSTGAAGRVLAIATLQGLPYQTESFNGRTIGSFVGAAAQGVITQASAQILNSRDSIKKSGGVVATNVGTSYLAKANVEAVNRFQSLGLPGSLLRSYAATIDSRVTRVAASATARAAARLNGAPTGKLVIPVVTMHTEFDPFVTAGNEAIFAKRVAALGTGARVLQLYVAPPVYADRTATGGGAPYGAGHCVFTTRQWLAQLDTLTTFIAHGKAAAVTAVNSIWAADGAPGLNRTFTPIQWTSTAR